MMVIKVSYHIFCGGIYMYDEGANKCSYFKHYEDRVSCTRQFIVQNLISYKLNVTKTIISDITINFTPNIHKN